MAPTKRRRRPVEDDYEEPAPRRRRTRDDDADDDYDDRPTRRRLAPRDEEPDDDDYDDRPRRRRRRDEEPDDEEPEPRRRRSRDEEPDDEEPDERPRGRRRSRDDDDDDEEPEPRRRRAPRDEEPPEDDYDDRPPRRGGGKGKRPKAVVREGWGGAQAVFDSSSSYAQSFRLTDVAQIICFLEDRPYAGYSRHWIERVTVDDKGKRTKSNRPYTCPDSIGLGECPICEVGDRPQAVSAFNIAVIADDGVVSLKSWEAGQKVYKILKANNDDPKIGPLTKGYYVVKQTGDSGTRNYMINPVRASSLEREWGIEEPYPEDFDDLTHYDSSIIETTPRKELEELAAEMTGYGDDDGNWGR